MTLPSHIKKRSIVVGGRRTSVCMEDVFWDQLRAIAKSRAQSLHDLVAEIDNRRERKNLSSAIRMFIVSRLMERTQRNELFTQVLSSARSLANESNDRKNDVSALLKTVDAA